MFNRKKITELEARIAELDGQLQQKDEQLESERKQYEQQLCEREKAIGANFAHIGNNALSAIMGNLDLVMMENLPDKVKENLESAYEASERISLLIDKFFIYTDGKSYRFKPESMKMDDYTSIMARALEKKYGDNVDVAVADHRYAASVKVDSDYMNSVLDAMVENSIEAIGNKNGVGNIKVIASYAPGYSSDNLVEGNYLKISVEDDGEGMSMDTMSRIFEPFFSTGFQGRGMGMAVVNSMVKAHGGEIVVDSEEGKGTRVDVYLPIVEPDKPGYDDSKAE